MIIALKDTDKDVRRKAADALGKIGDPTAIAALIAALNHDSWDVRRKVAKALEQIGTPEALEAVEDYRRRYPRDRW